MAKQICKLELLRNARESERKMYAAKMDWHMSRIIEAHEAGNQFDAAWHDAEIAGCELRLHQLRKG